jgi:hypothetical protein
MLSLFVLAAAVAFAAVTWTLAGAAERRRDARRIETIRAAMGAPVDPLGREAGSLATVEGTIANDSPAIVTFHPEGTSFLAEPNVYATTIRTHHEADPPIVLELGEGKRAVIEGAVQVVSGRTESEHGASLDRAALFGADALGARDDFRTRIGQFRRVAPGDVVRVRGAIAPAPDDAALYRGGSNVVAVRPPKGAEQTLPRAVIIASATTPARLRTRPSFVRWGATAVAFLVGASAVPLFHRRSVAPSPIANATATTVACREKVLSHLEHDRPDAAARERCTDPQARAMLAYANGEFVAASDAFADALTADPSVRPSLSETEAHLFAHRPDRAAVAARRMVAHFYPGPSTAEKRYLECVAGLVDRLAAGAPGEPRAPRDKMDPALHPNACSESPLLELAHQVDRENHLGGLETEFPASYDAVGQPVTAVVAPGARLGARPVGVERDILDRFVLAKGPSRPPPTGYVGRDPNDDYGLVGYGRIGYFAWGDGPDIYVRLTAFAAELALFYAHAGTPERIAPYWPILDRVAASREASPPKSFHVVATLDPDPAWRAHSIARMAHDKKVVEAEDTYLTYVMSVAASAALLSGDEARVKRYAPHGEVHSMSVLAQVVRMRDAAAWETPKEEDHWPNRAELFSAVPGGDGRRIADILAREKDTGRDTLPRILPRLQSNRAALDAWFDDAFPVPCMTCGASAYLGHLADRRAVAALLGKKEESARLAPVIARFVDAETDEAVAWEIAELETFFARPR